MPTQSRSVHHGQAAEERDRAAWHAVLFVALFPSPLSLSVQPRPSAKLLFKYSIQKLRKYSLNNEEKVLERPNGGISLVPKAPPGLGNPVTLEEPVAI